MSDYEINREIVFSTGHIAPECGNALGEFEQDEGVNDRLQSTLYGYRILVAWLLEHGGIEEIENHTELTCTGLLRLAGIAYEHQCKWLVLDRDGPVYPDIRSYLDAWSGKQFEVVLPGFDGADHTTDHLVLWVAAPDQATVQAGAPAGAKVSELPVSVPDQDIDFHLPEDVAIDVCKECGLPTSPRALSATGHRCRVCDPDGLEREGAGA